MIFSSKSLKNRLVSIKNQFRLGFFAAPPVAKEVCYTLWMQTSKEKPGGVRQATRSALKERQWQLRQDIILDAARRLMATRGYDAMTMDDVAQQVGIAKATLYQHVKSKEELALAVVVRATRHSHEYLRSLDSSLPAIERLRQVLTWIIEERFGEQGIDFRTAESSVLLQVKTSAAYRSEEKAFMEGITQLINAAKAEGSISPELSTPILARALLSFIQDGGYREMIEEGQCTISDIVNTFLIMITHRTM